MHRGYIKIWRKIFDSGVQKEHETFTLWVWLLVNATRKELNYIVRGECIKLNPGEIIIGRKKLAIELGLSEQNVRTCLQHLDTWGNITIKATKRYSIIKINKWDTYQETEEQDNQQNGQEVTNVQPRANHKTRKRERENKEKDIMSGKAGEIIEYLNLKTGKKFHTNGANSKFVSARLRDGATLEDCKAVIDMKAAEWLNDPRMNEYLRPETLFNQTKFESYRNSLVRQPGPKRYGEIN